MNRMPRILILPLLVIMLSGCSVGNAPGLLSVTAVIGEQHTLRDGERVPGDLYVLAGELTVVEGGAVGGSLLVLGGSATVGGTVGGDISLIGGSLQLLPSAQVNGALTLAGGELDLSPGARVAAGVRQAEPPGPVQARSGSRLVDELLSLLLPALGVALLAYLLARYLPRPFGRVTDALGDHFVVSTAMGLLAGITALVLLVLVAFTILLIPFSIAGAAALFIAIGYGWAAFGGVIGRRLVARWPRLSDAQGAALGGLAMMLAVGLFGLVPLAGLVVSPLAASAGLGAIILTRLGLRKFIPAQDDAPDVVVE